MDVRFGHDEGFGDLDLIFKVTAGLKLPDLSQKVLLCTMSNELVGRFQPDLPGDILFLVWILLASALARHFIV